LSDDIDARLQSFLATSSFATRGGVITDLDGTAETVGVEEELEAHERLNEEFGLMEKGLASLGEPCKSLLEAYYLQKRSMNEIAMAFGYTNADNAKTQKYKCLMRLKKIFFDQYKHREL